MQSANVIHCHNEQRVCVFHIPFFFDLIFCIPYLCFSYFKNPDRASRCYFKRCFQPTLYLFHLISELGWFYKITITMIWFNSSLVIKAYYIIWVIIFSLHCSEKIMFCFVPKQEGRYCRGYGHRPTALGVVGNAFHLMQMIKHSQFNT